MWGSVMSAGQRIVMRFLCLRLFASDGQGRGRRQARRFLVPLAALAFIVLSHSVAAAQLRPVRRILIFNEVGTSYPAMPIITQGIETALSNSPYHLEIYSEYMDTFLFPDPADQQEFRDFYIRKYQNRQPDVIITVGPSPLKFMEEAHDKAFPGVPVVFCLPLGDVSSARKFGSDFTGVGNDMDAAKTLELALRLQPGTEHLVVVGGSSNFDKQNQASLKQQINGFTGNLDVTYMTDVALPELLERLKHLPSHTLVLLLAFGRDAEGTSFKSNEIGSLVAAAANAPVFSLADVYLNHGEVGGYLSNLNQQGNLAGDMALRLLQGEKPRDIPLVGGAYAYMFDWKAVKRWGLKESEIPPGSIILNQPLTIWESYKEYIVGGISLILLEALFIGGLLWQRARRRDAENAIRESEERFRLVANTAPVMIWMSGPDKLCNYFNRPWLEFTGRPLEAELGDGWSEGVHPEDLPGCMDICTRAFDRRESFETHCRLRRYDGEYRYVLNLGSPRINSDGSFGGYIGSCIDITERKLAEEALASVGRRLIEAHEEERTWIARELHDDINQRIALLTIELARWDGQLPDSAVQFHNHIRERLLDLSEDIQALSHRLHSSKLEYLGIVAAARSFCSELSDKQRVEIDFNHRNIPDIVPQEISLCLFRVLQEALQNAVKYSGDPQFEVELDGTAGEIQLTVRDHGVGFDPNDAASRTGLGLISMRERLHLVGGELFIDSQRGSGTAIRAWVPFSSTNESESTSNSEMTAG
jgi:PAS domain S-box-containing protein